MNCIPSPRTSREELGGKSLDGYRPLSTASSFGLRLHGIIVPESSLDLFKTLASRELFGPAAIELEELVPALISRALGDQRFLAVRPFVKRFL